MSALPGQAWISATPNPRSWWSAAALFQPAIAIISEKNSTLARQTRGHHVYKFEAVNTGVFVIGIKTIKTNFINQIWNSWSINRKEKICAPPDQMIVHAKQVCAGPPPGCPGRED
jgi:hypothetical protein